LSLVARALLAGFVDLGWAVSVLLELCPDQVEAALKSGFHLTDGRMNRIVDGLEELGDLVDAKQRISVEDEGDEDLTGCERPAFEGCVAGVCERISAVGTPQPGTAVPGLDGGFAAIWTGCFFPHLLAVPLDFLIERLWTQDY
jgi:hypothetical protein